MSDLIDTTEMYLKTVFELLEEGIPPMRARIAERLGHSGPTVSQTVARMERDGLLVVTSDRHLQLTDEGAARATRVMRKHRLAERLLTDVIGLEWPLVHDEACRWEHVMSDQVERRLVPLLGEPQHDPYGNPIPGLEAHGVAGARQPEVVSLGSVVSEELAHAEKSVLSRGEARDLRLERIGEPLQVDTSLLQEFLEAGIAPPTPIRVSVEDEQLILSADDSPSRVELPLELAKHLFVRPG